VSDHLELINSNYFTIMLMLLKVNVYISTFNDKNCLRVIRYIKCSS